MIRLLPEERQTVVQYIHSICAIALDPSKDYLIESRLSVLMEETRCASFSELISRSRSEANGALKRRIIDQITTNETFFFRDSSPFDLLRFKIIPDLIDRRARLGTTVPIRIWSAACSTGQEIYSICIVLRELLGDLNGYNVRLLGTDISDQAVARASEGIFSQIEIARGLTDSVRDKSFVPTPRAGRSGTSCGVWSASANSTLWKTSPRSAVSTSYFAGTSPFTSTTGIARRSFIASLSGSNPMVTLLWARWNRLRASARYFSRNGTCDPCITSSMRPTCFRALPSHKSIFRPNRFQTLLVR